MAAFEKYKKELANVALMAHPDSDIEIRVCSDVSDFAIGASLEQFSKGHWQRTGQVLALAFFSRKFTPTQMRCSTYDRELTATY